VMTEIELSQRDRSMEGKGEVEGLGLGWVRWYFCGLGRLRVAHMAHNEFDDSSLQLDSTALLLWYDSVVCAFSFFCCTSLLAHKDDACLLFFF
jgi:hypothetical protein